MKRKFTRCVTTRVHGPSLDTCVDHYSDLGLFFHWDIREKLITDYADRSGLVFNRLVGARSNDDDDTFSRAPAERR